MLSLLRTPRPTLSVVALLLAAPLRAQGPVTAHATPPTDPGTALRVPGAAPANHVALMGPAFDVRPGVADDGTALVFPGTRVAANGMSLRQCTSGAINLVGVPPGSVIVRAYLYWQWISLPAPVPGLQDALWIQHTPRVVPNPAGGLAMPARFRPVRVAGTLVGSGPDPCWLGGANFTYRADVTRIVSGGATYQLWLPAGAAPAADWTDPFSQFSFPPGPYCEGASLVVVYASPSEPPGTTLIYDTGLAGTMFVTTPGISYNLTGFTAPGSESRWINIGGDGQTGAGYGDVFSLGLEMTVFQGLALAGGGAGAPIFSFYNDSDWNGSANKPVGQLWDTSGHEVSAVLPAGSTAASVTVFDPTGSPFADCLVPAANVLWIR